MPVVQEVRKYQRILPSDKSINILESQGFEWVFSSNVSAAAVRGKDLIIRFHNGSIYSYSNQASAYEQLMAAASKGKWVWRFLRRPKVPYKRIGSLPLPEDTDETDEEIVLPRIPTYEVKAIVPTTEEQMQGVLPQISIQPVVQPSDIEIGINTRIAVKPIDTVAVLATPTIPFFRTNKNWFRFDKKKDIYVLTKEAPKEAQTSYQEYLKEIGNKG